MNRRSDVVTKGLRRSFARGMLRALGFNDADFEKPLVAVASTWSEITPCNMHIDKLALESARGVNEHGGKAQIIATSGVSDGISMGTEGMKYSLVSREWIADTIEGVTQSQAFDALVTIGGCDKNMPGCLMAMARLKDLPSIFVYGGTIMPGQLGDRELDIISIFEAVGEHSRGKITKEELHEIECRGCPGPGSCGGMYTANTMSSAIEALGMSLPNSSSQPAISKEKNTDCYEAGKAVLRLRDAGIATKDILTKTSFENAIAVVMALGGSTNAVLHLIAIAKSAGIDLTLDDFRRIGERTPYIADLKPSGKYTMIHLHRVGGLTAIMRYLLDQGLISGTPLTVTGKTVAENLEAVKPVDFKSQDVIVPVEKSFKQTGHIVILKGNLAPDGAVAKITGKEGLRFTGVAKIYESEEAANDAILGGKVGKGDVVVIRYEGPKGGPGMREMLAPTSAIVGMGLSKDVGLITDGRFSGGSHGFVVGHVTPEAQDGGPIGLIKDGDRITIDAEKNELSVDLPDAELAKRKSAWKPMAPRYPKGVLAKYVKLVSSASQGAVTD